jgi:hypothetical protein
MDFEPPNTLTLHLSDFKIAKGFTLSDGQKCLKSLPGRGFMDVGKMPIPNPKTLTVSGLQAKY